MKLPFEEKEPTFAELKEKGITWRTRYYNLWVVDQLNHFTADLEQVINNPMKFSIYQFVYDPLVDGTPCVMIRFRDDDKLDLLTRKIFLWAKMFTTKEFDELDKIINAYDRTTLYLLAEKRYTMKTGDFFVLLIWATVEKPLRSTEGIDELKRVFLAAFSK
jgi:hypothetical protein